MQPQQQPPTIMNNAPTVTYSLTTEQIQQLLDENNRLILTILDYQSTGRVAEAAPYQEQLKKNLEFLANAADAQGHPGLPFAQQQQQPPVNFLPQQSTTQGQIGLRPYASPRTHQAGQSTSEYNAVEPQGSRPSDSNGVDPSFDFLGISNP